MQKSKLSLGASCQIFLCNNQIKSNTASCKIENRLCATIRVQVHYPHLLSDEDGAPLRNYARGKHNNEGDDIGKHLGTSFVGVGFQN